MTSFYLIRHGSNDFYSHTLVGRKPGIHLNETGLRESKRLAEYLAGHEIEKIFSSPLERCRETAEPIAQRLGQKIEFSDTLLEVDFGEWTGKTFEELDRDERWKQWNAFRSGERAPNGESMLEVQTRMTNFILNARSMLPRGVIAMVGHADPLRAVVGHFLGAPLDFIRRIEMSPASVTILDITEWNAQIRCLNLLPGAWE